MPQIMTVRGPIAPDELGFTSMHEHILYDGSVYRTRFESMLPEGLPVKEGDLVSLENIGALRHNPIMAWDAVSMHDVSAATAEVADYKAAGGDAMVDMSAPGLRSDLVATRQISQETDVHIVASTGLYMEASWPERFHVMTTDQLVAHMKHEIDEGIDDTGVMPGHIKVAIEEGFTTGEEKLLRAAARVSNETGMLITVHLGVALERKPGGALRIVDMLCEEGLSLERAILCHIQGMFTPMDKRTLVLNPDSWKLDLDTSKELLDRGAQLSIDCFGHEWNIEAAGFMGQTDWQRLAGLVGLIQAGYAEQLVIGTDTYLKILTRRFGGQGYCRLTDFVVPSLRELGIAETDIQRITRDNPARLLAY